jgi:small-conductance mechanosensitive channel
VQIGAITGVVETVHIFSTTLLTADNKDVVIPNGKIIADSIVNYSRHPFRRIDLMISVGYDSRIAEVKRVILAVIDADKRIDRQRDTTVRLAELGASSLNFTVRVWVKTPITGIPITICWRILKRRWTNIILRFLIRRWIFAWPAPYQRYPDG